MCVVCMNCVTVCTYVVYLRMCMHTSCTCFTAHVYIPMYINVCAVLCVYVQYKPYSAYHSYIHIHICIRSFVGNST